MNCQNKLLSMSTTVQQKVKYHMATIKGVAIDKQDDVTELLLKKLSCGTMICLTGRSSGGLVEIQSATDGPDSCNG